MEKKKIFITTGGTGGLHYSCDSSIRKFKKRGHIVEIISDKKVKNF